MSDGMIFAAIALNGSSWWIAAIIAIAVLAPLAWLSWTGRSQTSKGSLLSRFLRILALALLALALLDPQWTSKRPSKGENIVAVLVDNSAGLQLIDTDSELSRGALAKQILTEENAPWLADLQEDFQVRFYEFDDSLRRVRDLTGLNFEGKQSMLGNALQQLSDRFQNQPLAAVVAITDGIVSDIDLENSNLSAFPVFTVPIGSDQSIADARIGELNIKQTAFDDTPIRMNANIIANEFVDAKSITTSVTRLDPGSALVTSSSDGALPSEQSIEIRSASDQRNLEFEWRPIDSGIQFYKVGLKAPEGEIDRTPQNDQRLFMVDRGKKSFRILYVTGRPNWEYKFLNRALLPDPQLEMSALIRVARREPKFEFKGRAGESSNPLFRGFGKGDGDVERYDQPVLVRLNTRDEEELRGGFPGSAEELFEYDAIIIDDLEAEFFNYSQQSLIRRFVSERGGGLLVLGGAEALESGGYEGTPIAATLPVYLDRGAPPKTGERWKWKLTREGWVEPWARIRPNEALEEDRIESMPSFRVLNALQHIKPGARALAVVEDEYGSTLPGIVAQNYGAGKSACIAVGDLWRWAMQGPKAQDELAKQWRQIARWLVTDAPQPVDAKAVRMENGSIRINIVARDKEFRSLDIGNAKIHIKRIPSNLSSSSNAPVAEFTETTLDAFPVSDSPGQFSAEFSGKDEGAYLARITVSDEAGAIIGETETGWVEEPAWSEFQRLTPNKNLLRDLASKSGGELVELSNLASLPEKITSTPAPLMETYSTPIWHKSWFFLIILACLLAEWGIRRKQGLA